MINIYVTNLSKHIIPEDRVLDKYISADRKKRANILTDFKTRDNFIKAEIFTATILEKVYKVDSPVIVGKQGEKIRIKGHSQLSLSRSYSQNLLCLAIDSDNKIGIDCEYISEFDDNILKYFFTKDEIAYIYDSKDSNKAFYLLWTRKESIVKCSGKGLSEDLRCLNTVPYLTSIKNDSSKEISPLYKYSDNVNGYFVNSYIYDDLIISVCTAKNVDLPDLQIK